MMYSLSFACNVCLLVVGLCAATAFGSDCRTYDVCHKCLDDPSCGWCSDYDLCVEGNKNGPYEGECDWNYYRCPNSTNSSAALGWLTFGSNSQRTGYYDGLNNFELTASLSSDYQLFTLFNSTFSKISGVDDTQIYITDVAINNNSVYFHEYIIGSQVNLYSVSLSGESNDNIWSTSLNYSDLIVDYCSQPSITSDGNNVISLCYTSSNKSIKTIMFVTDAATGITHGKVFQMEMKFHILQHFGIQLDQQLMIN